jgi:hypothetical protein
MQKMAPGGSGLNALFSARRRASRKARSIEQREVPFFALSVFVSRCVIALGADNAKGGS